jgi:hypothetical protein
LATKYFKHLARSTRPGFVVSGRHVATV